MTADPTTPCPKANLLLVDDQPANLLALEAILDDLGHNLVRARSGEEALRLMQETEFAVVLLDVQMPLMDGFETAKRIRRREQARHTPIIFITAYDDQRFPVDQAYALGVVDYLMKPLVPVILRAKVTGFVELFQKTEQIKRQAERLRQMERREFEQKLAEENARLRASERRLREADRRKDEFLAMLGHELRNPLAPVRNAVHVLKLLGNPDPNFQRSREMIERQVQHLTRLVDDLLEVSRITSGKIKLQKEPADVAAAVARAVETSQPLIEGRGHRLTVRLPDRPVVVEGDVTRLAQVLANLLNNAVKYTPDGGHIGVTVEAAGGEAVVRVRDTGMGIPPELLPNLFELFTQGDRSLARAEGGLGIGLTLVKRLVEMHGGRVEASSAGPGKGSEFVVRLPALPAGTACRAAEPAAADVTPGPARRVLVVDDNKDSADSLAMLLAIKGHEVRTAHDGPGALVRTFAWWP